MPTDPVVSGAVPPPDTRGIRGHPAGLTTLFLTELWERFSYYGMRAILVLFMVAPGAQGGLGFDTKSAFALRNVHHGRVPAFAPRRLLADRLLKPQRTVLLGAASWRSASSCSPSPPSASSTRSVHRHRHRPAQTEHQHDGRRALCPGRPRRDSGFSIFYMGINVGALMAPLVCGWLAESPAFKGIARGRRIRPDP